MEAKRPHPNLVLREEPSNISDYSVDSTSTLAPSPPTPFQYRPNYQLIPSVPEGEDIAYKGADHSPQNANIGRTFSERSGGFGLGINLEDRRTSLPRVPVGSRSGNPESKSSPGTPAAYDPLLSPQINDGHRQRMGGMGPPYGNEHATRGRHQSNLSMDQTSKADDDYDSLQKKIASSTCNRIDASGRDFECRSKRNIHHSRGNWLSVMILILAIYSTVFSGIWLLLAIIRPRYGQRISNGSSFSPSTASLLCAAFAKSIELSFTTVFVAFLGQVLSRRAFARKSRGITIAEMSMRSWIMQPGTLLTHPGNVGHAALTVLGMIALTAALMGMFYTTASDALVTPKLKRGNWEPRILYGKVATQFANPDYIKAHCATPISKSMDPEYAESTCVELDNAGQAFHNFQQYRSDWDKFIAEGNITGRPNPVGLLYDNTTVIGSWMHPHNMTELSARHGRIINNITMAMPHAGVFAAAREPINGIRQPQDMDIAGEYLIRASVPSPAVNILCAEMSEDDLAPMIYTAWPGWNSSAIDPTQWPHGYDIPRRPSWVNRTAVDDVFGFGKKYDRRHPVFPKYPVAYNTILNSTIGYFDSIYLLAASASESYMLCSIRQSLTPNCSTIYRASLSGGLLESRCEEPTDDLAYRKSDPKASNGVLNRDWINVAISWATALSLNAGVSDANAANARLLSQLIPTERSLNPSLPSIAEGLAVLAGNTLLTSSLDSPFIHFWNYSTTVPTLAVPQYQGFNASVQTHDYASGGTQRWQGMFYVVLTLVFLTNVFCLGYFLIYRGLVTDFIEPQNMFCLTLNSPPSRLLDGSCGGGPEKDQFLARWFIGCEPDREHFFIQEGEVQPEPRNRRGRHGDRGRHGQAVQDDGMGTPLTNMYTKLSKRSSML